MKNGTAIGLLVGGAVLLLALNAKASAGAAAGPPAGGQGQPLVPSGYYGSGAGSYMPAGYSPAYSAAGGGGQFPQLPQIAQMLQPQTGGGGAMNAGYSPWATQGGGYSPASYGGGSSGYSPAGSDYGSPGAFQNANYGTGSGSSPYYGGSGSGGNAASGWI